MNISGNKVTLRDLLSNEAKGFVQFVKYGVIGVMATAVQTGIFYVLAFTCLKCITPDDVVVVKAQEWLSVTLPSVSFTGEESFLCSRGTLAALATAGGFVVANVFCWLMNRWFVFKPGKFRWYAEFGMFFGAATLATVIALGVMKALIDVFGMMTTFAVIVEVFVSFFVNFFVRKFVIFRK